MTFPTVYNSIPFGRDITIIILYMLSEMQTTFYNFHTENRIVKGFSPEKHKNLRTNTVLSIIPYRKIAI